MQAQRCGLTDVLFNIKTCVTAAVGARAGPRAGAAVMESPASKSPLSPWDVPRLFAGDKVSRRPQGASLFSPQCGPGSIL